jgi:hypothetical protein
MNILRLTVPFSFDGLHNLYRILLLCFPASFPQHVVRWDKGGPSVTYLRNGDKDYVTKSRSLKMDKYGKKSYPPTVQNYQPWTYNMDGIN